MQNRFFLFLAVVLTSQMYAVAGPVYEQLAAFRPTPKGPGTTFFQHSDGSFYGTESGYLFRITPSGELTAFAPIRDLSRAPEAADFVESSDGRLWAALVFSGVKPRPAVVRFDPESEKLEVVAWLPQTWIPNSGLTDDGLGFLWGTTRRGGGNGNGLIYKINQTTHAVSLVHLFSRPSASPVPDRRERLLLVGEELWGGNPDEPGLIVVNARTGAVTTIGREDTRLFNPFPRWRLTRDEQGDLWTTTGRAVIKFNVADKSYRIVTELAQDGGLDHFGPNRLVRDGLGFLWGTAVGTSENALNHLFVFKVNDETGELVVVHEFEGLDGDPRAPGELAPDRNGNLWATAQGQGTDGSIFKVNIVTGATTIVARFHDRFQGPPGAQLVPDDSGNLWGILTLPPGAFAGGGAVFKIDTAAAQITIVNARFGLDLNASNGLYPGAQLVSGADGNLWGAASEWGPNAFGVFESLGNGFIYKVDPVTWTTTRVIEFTEASPDMPGAHPLNGLTADPLGQLWGRAALVDASGRPTGGFVFKVDSTTGQLQRVADFGVVAPLTYDDVDSMWGTLGSGELFKVNIHTGALTMLGVMNPSGDENVLVSDGHGFLWGTRVVPGPHRDEIFKIDVTSGELTRATFLDAMVNKVWGLAPDKAGNIWGTVGGGPLPHYKPGFGAVFRIDADTGRLAYVHNVPGRPTLTFGVITTPLVSDGANGFYGATTGSGTFGFGTIFKVTPTSFRTLFTFTGTKGNVPGAFPNQNRNRSLIVRHSDGNLYGSTIGGGILEDGKPAGGGVFYRIRFGPTPVTLPADEIAATTAVVHGTINPHGAFASVSFDIGLDPELKAFWTVSAGALGPRTSPRPVQALLEHLSPGTVYYFRITGESSENDHPQRGAILSFETGE